MGAFGVRLGCFCGAYLHSCQMRHKEYRFHGGHRDTHGGGAGDVLCMRFCSRERGALHGIPRRELLFICLSGLATGASWLCYYKALRDGLASVVVPIDKLSILVTVAFSCIVLKEKLSVKAICGLVLIAAGTLLMLVQV